MLVRGQPCRTSSRCHGDPHEHGARQGSCSINRLLMGLLLLSLNATVGWCRIYPGVLMSTSLGTQKSEADLEVEVWPSLLSSALSLAQDNLPWRCRSHLGIQSSILDVAPLGSSDGPCYNMDRSDWLSWSHEIALHARLKDSEGGW